MKVHRNCCGLDVHKDTIAACLIREDASGMTTKEKRLFGTMTQHLRELAQWLREAQVSAVAMEATGVYWVPVWNVLEREGLELLLINPEHNRAIRGKRPISRMVSGSPNCYRTVGWRAVTFLRLNFEYCAT